MLYRTFLFAPANHGRRVDKALTLPADAVILDLEDAVAIAEKPAAREVAQRAFPAPRNCALYVRVNAIDTEHCFDDLMAVVQPGIDGIVLPKVETAAGLLTVDWLMAQFEQRRGLPRGGIDLIPILETAKGVVAAGEIASAPSRIRRIAFGAGDYTLDIGVNWTRDEQECRHARNVIVNASRAHGLEAPLDSAFVRLNDADGLASSAREASAMGFQGKMCIHPMQIDPVNEIFSPTDAEVLQARRVSQAFAEAEARGISAIALDGKLVDYPIAHRARRVLARREEIERRGAPHRPPPSCTPVSQGA